MSQPIEISDELVLDAERTAGAGERSIAEQIEFWAHLGRAVEPLIEGSRAIALQRPEEIVPLSESLATVDTENGRRRVASHLQSQPFPHYEQAPDDPKLLIRIETDGTRT